MGKKLFQKVYISQSRTAALALPGLIVVGEPTDGAATNVTYHAVHESYFSKEKFVCPYCQKSNTAETKIRPRKFKDILPSTDGEHHVIDLIFHQRFFRCNDCKRIIRESIDFAEDGCRYTNRLSDLLAEGTLTQTYEQVCKKYGVPASKTSVGVIMRRRLNTKVAQLPPLETPDTLAVFVAYYFSAAYPVVLGIYDDKVRLIDILSESSESTYSLFFKTLDKGAVSRIFIDPDEQLHNAATAAFPGTQIMISEECVQRYIREAFKDVIKKEGPRCFVSKRYHTLCKSESYLLDKEQKQVSNTKKRRHRLAAAYDAYQDLLRSMSVGWDIERIIGWVNDLPEYLTEAEVDGEQLDALNEFAFIRDFLRLYEPQVNAYLALVDKPPAIMASAITSILDSIEETPFCIYDVLRARMLLNTEHDWVLKDGEKYRIGIPVERLTETMSKIADNIKKKRENEEDGYESED
jgi:transposase